MSNHSRARTIDEPIAQYERVKENRAEMRNESQEEQVSDDGVRLAQDRVEHRTMREDRRQMQRSK